MKKYLISIGAVATALAPIVTVVSCKNSEPTPLAPKTDKEFAKAIKDKKSDIKKYAETLTIENIKSKTIKIKTMSLVGANYNVLKKDLTVKVESSTSKGKIKITLTVGTQGAIIIDDITPKATPITTEDLKIAITDKADKIKITLNGKTSEMTIDKVKDALKAQLDDKFDTLIEALTLKEPAIDNSVTVVSGSTDITIETSTTTPIVTADLKNAIENKKVAIKDALNGKTSEMTIKKVKNVLKANLEGKFDTLIEALTLKEPAIDNSVTVVSGSTDITIETSTTTPIVTADLKKAIENKKVAIKDALNGKTSEMTIEKVKNVLKAQLEDKFNTLIEALTLKEPAIDNSVTVVSGSTDITIETSTTTPIVTADLKKAIENKKVAIKDALNGKTSEMTIDKVKNVLKAQLEDKFNTLIEALTLKEPAIDNSVTVVSGSTDITIETSTTTPIVTADLKKAIENKKVAIKDALNGKTSEMTIDKVKNVLKANLEGKFDTLIEALTLKEPAIDNSVTVVSGSTDITIETSTTTPIVTADLKKAIENKKVAIKDALNGKTSEMTIEKVKNVLKAQLEDKFNTLIEALTLKEPAIDNSVTVVSGSTDITIETSTTTPIVTADLKKAIEDKKVAIKNALNGKTSEMTIDKVKNVLKTQLDDKFDTLIEALTLKEPAIDNSVTVVSGSTDITIETSTTTPIVTADLKKAIENKKVAIKDALNGKTSEMTIEKVKNVLKAQLEDKFNTLIEALTLKEPAIDNSVTVVSGSTDITIETSTTTPIVTADLKKAIEDKKVAIKNALNGKTSEMTIDKVKNVLKTQLDDKFDTLIEALTLKEPAIDNSVTVVSGSTDITIETSTTA